MDSTWLPTLRRLTLCAALLAASAAASAQSLDARLDAVLAKAKGGKIGVHILEIKDNRATPLYAHNADTPLTPASNMKIIATAAALEKYGSKASFKTQLYRVGNDLVLLGSGDPGFADAKLFEKQGWTVTAVYDHWAAHLAKAGITEVADVVLNDSIFDSTFVHPSWPADQRLAWYQAPVGGMNFNANCLDFKPLLTNQGIAVELIPPTSYVSVAVKATRGNASQYWMYRPENANSFQLRGTVAASAASPQSVTIVDPGLFSATILRDRLLAAGIKQTGTVRRLAGKPLPQNAKPVLLATHETPLMAVIARANTDSVNMMAEALCKRLGHDATGEPGSWDNGTAAMAAYLKSLHLPDALYTLDDGSGLSPKNKVAPRALSTVLARVALRDDAAAYIETLATPGEEGTLRRRFRALPCAPDVRAKTGHIKGVSTLSGYLTVDDRQFAFSVLVNAFPGNSHEVQEQIVNELWKWAKNK